MSTLSRNARVNKYNGFNVYSKSGHKGTKCTIHIYDMIKEANPELLGKDNVKKAFNDFVDCLKKYDTLESYSPKNKRYIKGIKIVENTENTCFDNFKDINCRFTYENNRYRDSEINAKLKKDCFDIINSYIPLYELIKRDVVPYMELKQWEIQSKKEIQKYHNLIEKEENIIIDYQNAINLARARMCEYAKRAFDLHNPPERPIFD